MVVSALTSNEYSMKSSGALPTTSSTILVIRPLTQESHALPNPLPAPRISHSSRVLHTTEFIEFHQSVQSRIEDKVRVGRDKFLKSVWFVDTMPSSSQPTSQLVMNEAARL
ncbi:unnamed protein product [Ectocarpus sp. 8 AP-2014]